MCYKVQNQRLLSSIRKLLSEKIAVQKQQQLLITSRHYQSTAMRGRHRILSFIASRRNDINNLNSTRPAGVVTVASPGRHMAPDMVTSNIAAYLTCCCYLGNLSFH